MSHVHLLTNGIKLRTVSFSLAIPVIHCYKAGAIRSQQHFPLSSVNCHPPLSFSQLRLYVFEALFFMSVDLALNNVAATALITYAMVRAVALVRKALGAVNISQKTSIDLHFLS